MIGIKVTYTTHFLPEDVIYFKNPDFDPEIPYWRGENAVVLEDDMYYGHGVGINTAEQIIDALNQARKAETNQSAYLTKSVARPTFDHLAKLSKSQLGYSIPKNQRIVHHTESSIPVDRYMF